MDIVYSNDSLIVYLSCKLNNRKYNDLKRKLDYIINEYKINILLFRCYGEINIDNKYISKINSKYKDVCVVMEKV